MGSLTSCVPFRGRADLGTGRFEESDTHARAYVLSAIVSGVVSVCKLRAMQGCRDGRSVGTRRVRPGQASELRPANATTADEDLKGPNRCRTQQEPGQSRILQLQRGAGRAVPGQRRRQRPAGAVPRNKNGAGRRKEQVGPWRAASRGAAVEARILSDSGAAQSWGWGHTFDHSIEVCHRIAVQAHGSAPCVEPHDMQE